MGLGRSEVGEIGRESDLSQAQANVWGPRRGFESFEFPFPLWSGRHVLPVNTGWDWDESRRVKEASKSARSSADLPPHRESFFSRRPDEDRRHRLASE